MPTFSVIVPALDEAGEIRATLEAARRALGPDAELIVVDAGSRDATREIAGPLATVLAGPAGRGRQLNAGAEAAAGRILLFLHADTRLPAAARSRILDSLRDPRVAGGCFRFGLHPPPRRLNLYRLLELAVDLRTRLFRTATGDQAIFTRREVFRAVGGFPDLSLFEDVVFVRRLRRRGRFAPLRAVARTSRRRWERDGFWRTVALHWLLRTGFWAGVSPERLAGWYGRTSGRASFSARCR